MLQREDEDEEKQSLDLDLDLDLNLTTTNETDWDTVERLGSAKIIILLSISNYLFMKTEN